MEKDIWEYECLREGTFLYWFRKYGDVKKACECKGITEKELHKQLRESPWMHRGFKALKRQLNVHPRRWRAKAKKKLPAVVVE